jgi:hypothetical protein
MASHGHGECPERASPNGASRRAAPALSRQPSRRDVSRLHPQVRGLQPVRRLDGRPSCPTDAHNDGRGGNYTASRRPVTLLYSETLPTRRDAMARERQIKGWTARQGAGVDGRTAHRPEAAVGPSTWLTAAVFSKKTPATPKGVLEVCQRRLRAYDQAARKERRP